MRALDLVRRVLAWLSRNMAAERRMAQFTCGDCDRWERCGLPPTAACTHRAEALARHNWRERRRVAAPEAW